MSFYTDVISKDPRFGTTDVVNDLALLEPGTRKAVQSFLALTMGQGYDVRVAETYRSQVRQHYLWTKGLTKLSKVGCHGFGVAVDLQLFTGGKYDPDGTHYAFFEGLAGKVGLISGIGWGTPKVSHSFTDWDHLQRVPICRQAELFAGTWYPTEDYDPYADMRQRGIAGMASVPLPPVPNPVQPPLDHVPDTRTLQTWLTAFGYPCKVDSIMGDKTRAALRAWKASVGLPTSNQMTSETVAALNKAWRARG